MKKAQTSTFWLHYIKIQGITGVTQVHLLDTLNICFLPIHSTAVKTSLADKYINLIAALVKESGSHHNQKGQKMNLCAEIHLNLVEAKRELHHKHATDRVSFTFRLLVDSFRIMDIQLRVLVNNHGFSH